MISDSPYRTGSLVLTPASGALAGLFGVAWMLLVIRCLESFTNVTVVGILQLFGHSTKTNTIGLIIPIILFCTLGVCFGILYALCEQYNPIGMLIAVGIFYGFMLWVLNTVIIGMFLSEAARSLLRSWSFLLACLVYGFWLSLVAGWSARKKPIMATGPKD